VVAGHRHQQLEFGARWDNLRRIHYGRGEALAELELAEEFAADLEEFRLHPALLDMATAGVQALIDGFDAATDFYVPIGYTRLLLRDRLPRRLYSHIRVRTEDTGKDVAAFDITLLDEEGVVLAEISEFVLKRISDQAILTSGSGPRSSGRASAAAGPRGSSPVLEALEGAIRPAEGLEAFRRILGDRAAPQIVISPEELESWFQRLVAATLPPAPLPGPDDDPELRAELARVDEALAAHEAIAEAVVLARADRPGEIRLIAYVVYDQVAQATISELRRFLRNRLPGHLVPANFLELDELPLTATGEIDRRALPDPFAPEDDHVPPSTEMQKAVAAIWREVLGVERVGLHDNFFDIGGHSLLGVRVISRIEKQLGVRLNQAIMVLQTLEQIAQECERRAGAVVAAEPSRETPVKGLGRKLFSAVRDAVFHD
jgi:hypothetical protein